MFDYVNIIDDMFEDDVSCDDFTYDDDIPYDIFMCPNHH